jgi:hypothetical protein
MYPAKQRHNPEQWNPKQNFIYAEMKNKAHRHKVKGKSS